MCEPEEREVCIAQKGALRLRLLSHGRIAHGAMPNEGVNALTAMVQLLQRLLDLETRLQHQYGSHPLLGDLHITPTILRAPLTGDTSQINCLPGACEAYLDIRSVPDIAHAELLAAIQQEATLLTITHPAYRFEVETLDDRPSTATAVDDPVVQAVIAAHTQIYGAVPVIGGVPGATDGTILWRERAIPIVVYGPGKKRIAHQPMSMLNWMRWCGRRRCISARHCGSWVLERYEHSDYRGGSAGQSARVLSERGSRTYGVVAWSVAGAGGSVAAGGPGVHTRGSSSPSGSPGNDATSADRCL